MTEKLLYNIVQLLVVFFEYRLLRDGSDLALSTLKSIKKIASNCETGW
jgi:hypothetical protein